MSEELAIKDDNRPQFTNGGVYSSIVAESQEEKLRIFAAVSDCESVKDHLGEVLAITDVVMQPVVMENRATGEPEEALRIVLVDEDGKAYGATSTGLETSIKNMFAIVGKPTWEPAIRLVITEKPGKKGDFYTVTPVFDDKKPAKK